MSETEPQMSGGQPTNDRLALQQPEGAVELKKMDKSQQDKSDESGESAVAAPSSPAKHDEPTASSSTAKGKGRADPEPPAPDRQQPHRDGDDDSLVIEPTTGDGGSSDSNLVCVITLLLTSGTRHAFRIDEKYLTKRNVDIPGVSESGKSDPFSISVYKLKELILREWREEWNDKPSSPQSIRLIHFGKEMMDKEQLKKYFSLSQAAPTPNVVHMSVRPAEMEGEDEAGKGNKSGASHNNRREGRNGCCTIL